LYADPIKTYKVVIDPGHGGVKQTPYEIYGDKFDIVSGRYLEPYKNGAAYNGNTEMDLVLNIGKELKELLELTQTKKGFKKFQAYIRLFSNSETPWIKLDTSMSRTDSYTKHKFREKDDKNANYRLYDYPDFATGKMKPGRISWINSNTPQLVVSLHINDMGSRKNYDRGGMGAVLSPSYRTFDLLKSISEKRVEPEAFLRTHWSNWMIFQGKWTPLENAIADAWIYFHGYWPNKMGDKTDLNRFEGYRYNMVTWKYKDDDGWENRVGNIEGPYALTHELFRPVGRFWDRERSSPEIMRREGGAEGFGGDNHFASAELLRFVQYGLRLQVNSKVDRYTEPNPILRPYVSTYSLPMLINAISAYIELGDIRSERDIYFLTKKKKKIAVALAVGIYSLFQGLEIKEKEYQFIPKGKRLEFEKYVTKTGESYFQDVINYEGNANE
jgi:hypothetical protein